MSKKEFINNIKKKQMNSWGKYFQFISFQRDISPTQKELLKINFK